MKRNVTYEPIVKEKTLIERNDSENLYQVKVKLQDGTLCRVFYNHGEKSISRLLTIPCPICRKDFICKCLNRFADQIDSQVNLPEMLAE
ncbi:hypothetical protein LQV63_18775 [Paenibacillus profundus]|uniref:Uncharacterized protein n=1 Tax=Paenibacillus profundus TaxID=1173085 RepID=A0ABS8YHB7_9BACL|nr:MULTISPECIES: hypothetical protein [Paenibacillus]MCE5171348.1 hypothetical protein [Paenibacillus profundus]